jgi:hypothetical protein
MKLHDPFTRLSRDTARHIRLRDIRLYRARRAAAPGRSAPLRARAREREQRGLTVLDRSLAADAPRLESMFHVFNQLASGEGPVTGERIPVPPRRRPNRLHLVLMVGLAVFAGLCFALSTQLHTPLQQCVPASSSATVATSTAYAQEHGMACPAVP